MLKIKELYEKLSFDEEIIFQVKNKKIFEKIINEMKNIFNKWEFIFVEDLLNYKDTYFILGHWRDGMFKLQPSKEKDYEHEIYILADYKESPFEEHKHLQQIDDLIEIMDKYRNYFIKKRLTFDEHFNLVEKVEDKGE